MDNAPHWNGRKIAKDEDKHDLESRAAVYEFKHRMARPDAEHRAHHEYKQDKHREAAAYHMQGLKAAQAAGSHEEGHKHGMMYQLHMKELGLDPMGPVPHEIKGLADKQDKFYHFKAHRGDAFLLQDDGVKKSELAKADGKVLPFKGNPNPKQDLGQDAKQAGYIRPEGSFAYKPKEQGGGWKPAPAPEPQKVPAVKETAAAGSQAAPPAGNVLSAMPKLNARAESRKQLARTKVQGILEDAASIMAEDPGFKEAARQRDVEAKKAKLKAGGQLYKEGQTVSHVDPSRIPWKGVVHSGGYQENGIDGPGHYYEVRWWNPKLKQHHEDLYHQDDLKPG